MRVAAIQMQSVPNDTSRNVKRAQQLLQEAAARGVDLAVLPELFNTEYFPQERQDIYFEYAEPLTGPSLSAIQSTARETGIWIIASIFEQKRPGLYYDTSAVIDRAGQLIGAYRKTHPGGVFSVEKLYFRPGAHFPVFSIDDWQVGVAICYDNLFPETARILALHGAELLICPFASHPDNPVWRQLHSVRAFENGSYLLVANKVGLEEAWEFAGQSLIVHPSGETLAIASAQEDDIIYADIDREQVSLWRRRFPMLRDRRPELYRPLVSAQEDL